MDNATMRAKITKVLNDAMVPSDVRDYVIRTAEAYGHSQAAEALEQTPEPKQVPWGEMIKPPQPWDGLIDPS